MKNKAIGILVILIGVSAQANNVFWRANALTWFRASPAPEHQIPEHGAGCHGGGDLPCYRAQDLKVMGDDRQPPHHYGQILCDQIVSDCSFTPPDPFHDNGGPYLISDSEGFLTETVHRLSGGGNAWTQNAYGKGRFSVECLNRKCKFTILSQYQ